MEKDCIAKNIRTIRKKRGLTQKQLATLCEMSEAQISQYEIGYRTPRYKTICKLAKALNVSTVDFFLNDAEIKKIGKTIDIAEKEFCLDTTRYLMDLNKEKHFVSNLGIIDDTLPEDVQKAFVKLLDNFSKLNQNGRKKLFERLEELLEMPKYTEK